MAVTKEGRHYYSAVADTGEGDGEEFETPNVRRQACGTMSQRRSALVCVSIANIILFALTLSMYAGMNFSSSAKNLLNANLRAVSSYSPVFDMIDLEPSIRRLNGTVVAPSHPSIARQMPNPVADAQWEEDVDLVRIIPITREDIEMMGGDVSTTAKLEDKDWGLGDNALRRAAYGSYYNISLDANNPEGHLEGHVNHCADILFQVISCSNNLNIVTRNWREDATYPFPDFSINKYCINFHKLNQWHKDMDLDGDKYERVMRKPPGVKEKSALSL